MSELSELIYIKSHTTLHMKSNAENVDGMLCLMDLNRF